MMYNAVRASLRTGILISALVALFAVACGGGGDDFDGDTITSSDGGATLLIPAGALPEGVEASDVTIEPIPLEDFELSEGSRMLAAYELSPDGLQLAEPATLRLALPDDIDGELILVLHLSEDSLEFLPIQLSMNGSGSRSEIEMEISHFSTAWAVSTAGTRHAAVSSAMGANSTMTVDGGFTHEVGEPFEVSGEIDTNLPDDRVVEVSIGQPGGGVVIVRLRGGLTIRSTVFQVKTEEKVDPIPHPGDDVTQANNFTFVQPAEPENPFTRKFVCNGKGDQNEIAFRVWGHIQVDWQRFGSAGTPTRSGSERVLGLGFLLSRVHCVVTPEPTQPPESTETTGDDEDNGGPEGTATEGPPQPRSSRNTSNPINVSGASGSVGVNVDDCFDDDGFIDPCPRTVDVIGFSWGPADGDSDLLRVTVRLAGPFDGAVDTLVNVGFRGREGTPLGTNVILSGGEVSCTFPASGGPLEPGPGEVCGVNAAGEIELIRNVGGLVGPLRISVRSRQGSAGGGQVGDAVQINGIERP